MYLNAGLLKKCNCPHVTHSLPAIYYMQYFMPYCMKFHAIFHVDWLYSKVTK